MRHRARSVRRASSDSSTTSPATVLRRTRARTRGSACATRRGAAWPAGRSTVRDRPTTRVLGGSVVAHVGEELGPRAEVVRGLGELHDRAVRFARQEERFLPLRIGEVDVDRCEPGRRRRSIAATRSGTLNVRWCGPAPWRATNRARKSLCSGSPRFEQLDAHAVAGVVADPHLHRAEPDDWPPKMTVPPSAGQEPQRVRRVGGGERDVIEVVGVHDGVARRRPRRDRPDRLG